MPRSSGVLEGVRAPMASGPRPWGRAHADGGKSQELLNSSTKRGAGARRNGSRSAASRRLPRWARAELEPERREPEERDRDEARPGVRGDRRPDEEGGAREEEERARPTSGDEARRRTLLAREEVVLGQLDAVVVRVGVPARLLVAPTEGADAGVARDRFAAVGAFVSHGD